MEATTDSFRSASGPALLPAPTLHTDASRGKDLPDPNPKQRKHKVTVACDSCRAKKIKCDGIQPKCGPCCARKDQDACCTWIHGSARNDNQASREHITRLEKRIRELEQGAGGDKQSTANPSTQLPNYPGQESIRARPSVEHEDANIESSHSTMPAPKRPRLSQRHPVGGDSMRDNGEGSPNVANHTPRSMETPSSTVSGPTSAMIGSIGDDGNAAGFFGNSSAGNFISQVRQAVDQRMGSSRPRVAHLEADATVSLLANRRDDSSKRKAIDYILPSRKKADHLMNVYLNAAHPIYPFLDMIDLKTNYEALWAGKELSQDEPEFLCILNTIFALSCQLNIAADPDERRESSNAFFQRAQDLLDLWKPGSLQTVQSYLLLAQYLQSTNEPDQCWMFIGNAIRVAESLGLHLPETSEQVTPLKKRELYRKVWHGCILMDRFTAMTHGRPTMIHKALAAIVPLPVSVDDDTDFNQSTNQGTGFPTRTDFFIQSLQLYEVMHEILIGSYLPTPQKQISRNSGPDSYFGICKLPDGELSILDIDRKLMNWEKSLPPHLKFSQGCHTTDEEPADIFFMRQSVVLRQRFLYIRLLALRPILSSFIASEVDDSELLSSSILSCRLAHQCSLVCVKIAQEAIEIVHSKRLTNWATTGVVAAWWYNVLFVYSAATVLIAARLKSSIVSELGEDSILQSWQAAMAVLEGYMSFSDSVPRLVATLHLLFDEVPLRYSYHRQQQQQPRPDNQPDQSQALENPNWLQHMPQDMSVNYPTGGDDGTFLDVSGLDLDPSDFSWLSAGPFHF